MPITIAAINASGSSGNGHGRGRHARRPVGRGSGRFATGQVGHQLVEVGVRLGGHAGVEPFLELVAVEPAV